MADDLKKKEHSRTLSALFCIAHVFPLAYKSENVLICIPGETSKKNFHAKWALDGWNDDIIQPARDAVLNYYKVCATISLPTVLR